MHEGVAALIRGRMAELNLHSDDVGKLVYMRASSVRRKLRDRSFTCEELRDWCTVLGLTDPQRIGVAILADTKPPCGGSDRRTAKKS